MRSRYIAGARIRSTGCQVAVVPVLEDQAGISRREITPLPRHRGNQKSAGTSSRPRPLNRPSRSALPQPGRQLGERGARVAIESPGGTGWQ